MSLVSVHDGGFSKIARGPRKERKRLHVGGGMKGGPLDWCGHSPNVPRRVRDSKTRTY